MLIPTLILGSLILSTLRLCWSSFGLTEDPRQTRATIVSRLEHGVVQYKYAVNEILTRPATKLSPAERDEIKKLSATPTA